MLPLSAWLLLSLGMSAWSLTSRPTSGPTSLLPANREIRALRPIRPLPLAIHPLLSLRRKQQLLPAVSLYPKLLLKRSNFACGVRIEVGLLELLQECLYFRESELDGVVLSSYSEGYGVG